MRDRLARPSLGSAAGLCLAAVAASFGLARLSDNSFLTHLATGRLIVDEWHIPHSDPYTFTAHGEPWVVQSWLASLVYGLVDDLAGLGGIRVLMGLLTVGIFAIVWRLSRPAQSLLLRTALAGLVLAVGSNQWDERPLLFGLLALGATVLAGEGALGARWLLPIGWLWVNTHGSFPLGIVYLVVVLVGRWLDKAPAATEVRALRWLAGGVVLGAVNPLGPRILVFPLELLQKQDVLSNVIEWQAPAFRSATDRLFLLQVLLAVLALVRRPTYRSGLVLGVFVAAALLGSRNIAVASLVLVPVLAAAAPEVGTLRSATRGGLARPLAVVGAAALVLVAAVRLDEPHLDLDQYPTGAIELLVESGVDLEEVHLAAPDVVGNLLTHRFGPGQRVFYDDRFDLYPEAVSRDALRLLRGRPSAPRALDRWDVDLVLWRALDPLTTILTVDPAWRELEQPDARWALFCRRGADLGGAAGTC